MRGDPKCRLWQAIVQADESNAAFFAQRSELPGVVLFCAERADAEFDMAWIYGVPPAHADATLQAIVCYFRDRGRRPRVRLNPLSTPANWPSRLRRAGFVETDERLTYFSVPEMAPLSTNPAVHVERVVSLEDGDRFSAIQIAGFDLAAERWEWERERVQRHLAASEHAFYLASLDGRVVGAAKSTRVAGGPTGLAALATLPDARGRGVGTSLLSRMIDDARSAGSTVIFGTVCSGSYAAGMYDRLGFISLFATRTFAQCA